MKSIILLSLLSIGCATKISYRQEFNNLKKKAKTNTVYKNSEEALLKNSSKCKSLNDKKKIQVRVGESSSIIKQGDDLFGYTEIFCLKIAEDDDKIWFRSKQMNDDGSIYFINPIINVYDKDLKKLKVNPVKLLGQDPMLGDMLMQWKIKEVPAGIYYVTLEADNTKPKAFNGTLTVSTQYSTHRHIIYSSPGGIIEVERRKKRKPGPGY